MKTKIGKKELDIAFEELMTISAKKTNKTQKKPVQCQDYVEISNELHFLETEILARFSDKDLIEAIENFANTEDVAFDSYVEKFDTCGKLCQEGKKYMKDLYLVLHCEVGFTV